MGKARKRFLALPAVEAQANLRDKLMADPCPHCMSEDSPFSKVED